jgi:hypothetical protein
VINVLKATNGEGPMKGHPRPTGYRAYLEKVKITPNEQTSSTDAGESTDRSSNTESSQANGSITFKEFTFAARYVISLEMKIAVASKLPHCFRQIQSKFYLGVLNISLKLY